MKLRKNLLASASIIFLTYVMHQDVYGMLSCCRGDSTIEPGKHVPSQRSSTKTQQHKDTPPHVLRRVSSWMHRTSSMSDGDRARIMGAAHNVEDEEVSTLGLAVAGIFETYIPANVRRVLSRGTIHSYLLEALVSIPQDQRIKVAQKSGPWIQLLSIAAINPTCKGTMMPFLTSLEVEVDQEDDDEVQDATPATKPFLDSSQKSIMDKMLGRTTLENLGEQFSNVIQQIHAATLNSFSSENKKKLSTFLAPLEIQEESAALTAWERMAAQAVREELKAKYTSDFIQSFDSLIQNIIRGIPQASLASVPALLNKLVIDKADQMYFPDTLKFLASISPGERVTLLERISKEVPFGSSAEDRLNLLKSLHKYSVAHEELLDEVKKYIPITEKPRDVVELVSTIGKEVWIGKEHEVKEKLQPWLVQDRRAGEFTALIKGIVSGHKGDQLQQDLDAYTASQSQQDVALTDVVLATEAF